MFLDGNREEGQCYVTDALTRGYMEDSKKESVKTVEAIMPGLKTQPSIRSCVSWSGDGVE